MPTHGVRRIEASISSRIHVGDSDARRVAQRLDAGLLLRFLILDQGNGPLRTVLTPEQPGDQRA